ncbi:hypothetical protein HN51_067697 [Arachis hypogaea]|uniref:ATP-dependent zinc metalloprotease FTSH 3, mitochondrial isoform X1 n=2 Tax=Arachis hypogaea TaxID=3818 RepID=UPI000DECE367|nr:ATP-dependent zinc metalloprotease FTSH 3, mitochondrial isoform X2 [Arachis hypogaea]XP_029148194.1 ATP-dependent zinc metalloprotease FTSH 3, mitochondrial isoform X2 [Arachis hypogaea]QHO09146.1 ATP-dependent zinc metalloprotease FTSH 3 [Arachis hypogaea]
MLLMLELVETESFPVCLILSVFRRTLRFITGCFSAKDLRRIKSQRQTEMIMEMFTLFPLSNFFISSLVMALITVACFYRPEGQQINFQEFKYELLEPRLVDHIVVSINKSIARIYVRNTPRNQTDSEVVEGTLPAKGTGGQYKFYFNIGSVKSFEENLKAAQEELGLEPHDYVPVTYSFEVDWEQELMSRTVAAVFLGLQVHG